MDVLSAPKSTTISEKVACSISSPPGEGSFDQIRTQGAERAQHRGVSRDRLSDAHVQSGALEMAFDFSRCQSREGLGRHDHLDVAIDYTGIEARGPWVRWQRFKCLDEIA